MLVSAQRDDKGKLVGVNGGPVPEHLLKLRIPPAWTNVHVSIDPESKVYATGYDSKGRKQSLYSVEHTKEASNSKFERVQKLVTLADTIKARIESDLHGEDEEEAILALLIFEMGLRPGSRKDTQGDVEAFGATTLESRHIKLMSSGTVYLDFIGKKGVKIHQKVTNNFLVKELALRKTLAGGVHRRPVFESTDSALRAYLKEIAGTEFQVKDFRTLKGTSVAMKFLEGKEIPFFLKEQKKMMKDMIKKVASSLGNTPAIAKKSYIDPSVFKVFDIA